MSIISPSLLEGGGTTPEQIANDVRFVRCQKIGATAARLVQRRGAA